MIKQGHYTQYLVHIDTHLTKIKNKEEETNNRKKEHSIHINRYK